MQQNAANEVEISRTTIAHYSLIKCLCHNLYKEARLNIPDSKPADHL